MKGVNRERNVTRMAAACVAVDMNSVKRPSRWVGKVYCLTSTGRGEEWEVVGDSRTRPARTRTGMTDSGREQQQQLVLGIDVTWLIRKVCFKRAAGFRPEVK